MADDKPIDDPNFQASAEAPQPRGLGRAAVETLQLATIRGDIRDVILQEMRDAKNALPWTVRSEVEQREMIDRVDSFTDKLIRKVVEQIAAVDFPHLAVKVEKWGVDSKGLKVQLTSHSGASNIDALVEGGLIGTLVFASVEDLQGEREPITPMPDQAPLDLPDDDPGPAMDKGQGFGGGPKGGKPKPK